MELGIPNTSHFLVNDSESTHIVRITHLAWKNIGYSPQFHERYGHTKEKIYFESLEMTHTNLLGMAWKYRI